MPKKVPKNAEPRFPMCFRAPATLKLKLETAATATGRSVGQELVRRLERSFTRSSMSDQDSPYPWKIGSVRYGDLEDDKDKQTTQPDTDSTFKVGDQVEKYTGDYQLLGEVRAVFETRTGKVRYVVEHQPGFLHIYSAQNLRTPRPRATVTVGGYPCEDVFFHSPRGKYGIREAPVFLDSPVLPSAAGGVHFERGPIEENPDLIKGEE